MNIKLYIFIKNYILNKFIKNDQINNIKGYCYNNDFLCIYNKFFQVKFIY